MTNPVKKTSCYLLTALTFSVPSASFSQDSLMVFQYPSEKEINVSVRANVSMTQTIRVYKYTVSNSSLSLQRVWRFSVRHDATAQNLKAPDGWDARVAPIPFIRVSWSSSDSTRDIVPGGVLDGFQFSSEGLPIIGDFYATGYVEPPSFEVEPDSIAGGRFPENSFDGKTITANIPPDPFVAFDFLDTLLSYISQSVALGWLKNTRDNDCDLDERPEDGVANNFAKRLTKVRTELTDGDTIKASKELEKFIEKVERVSKRNEVMTSEAYALLKYNAEYLVGRIITLPTGSTGTLLQQIDELKAEVQNQQSKKNVGGLLLVKGLTALLDVAKQRLQQTDSMQTAITIGLFQLTVDETNKLTDALLEKNKPLPPLYVKDEAYVQLYYRAKYILEALPELRIDLQQQRQQMMEKELRQELDSLKEQLEQ
jgi:hypothetical protein